MNENMPNPATILGTGAGDFYRGDDMPGDIGGKDVRHPCSMHLPPNVMIDFHDDGQLRGFGIANESIKHLLITHCHYDHFRPYPIHDFARELPHRLTVYGSHTALEAMDFAAKNVWVEQEKCYQPNPAEANVNFVLVEPGVCFEIDDMRITPVHANHYMDRTNGIMIETALNFVLERGGQTLYYGLDCSRVLPDTFERLKAFRFDIAVLDATFGPLEIDLTRSGHLNWVLLDETIQKFKGANIIDGKTQIIASHLSVDNVEPYDQVVGQLAKKGIAMAYDGMKVAF